MSRSLTRVWPLLVLAFTSEVWALGLGDIRLSTALNEPIKAEIELLAATPEEIDNLIVTLASSDTFERYGLDRPLFLQDIKFKVVKTGRIDGNIITVVSVQPVTEPFVTFLVEATWSRGRLLREYTLLLDPPTFAPPPVQETSTAVTAPRQTTHVDSGRIERRPEPQTAPPPSRPTQPAPDPAPIRSAPPDPATFDTTGGGDYLVQRGDTLWSITRRMRPDSRLTMNQAMLAILEANPEAFASNVNIMSAGASLRIPSADEIFRINRGDALREVQRQNSEWGGVMPAADTTQPRLTLVPPDDDQTGYDSTFDTTVGDDAGVAEDPTETRIRDIEDTLAAHQDSLIEIQDDELAALRQELARLRGEEYVEPDLVDDDTTIDTQLDPDLIDDDLVADDTDTDAIGVDDTDATAPTPVVRGPSRDQPGIVDRVIEFLTEGIWGYLIGALLVVLGILVWFARRAARSEDDDSTGVWDALDADDVDGESLASTERLRALAQDDDTAIVVVEQESASPREPEEEVPAPDAIEVPAPPAVPQEPAVETVVMDEPPPEFVEEVDPLETTGEHIAVEDTFSSETAINLDQSDPFAEADFHMAYGLYDQAADLINGALAVEPDREDLLAKLCEIYFVWGNRDAFVDAAGRLRGGIGGDSGPEWDKIVIMGQQIASDHEMFSGAGPAPTREVDLAFEDGADDGGDLDMDFAAGTGESEVIDLGDATADLPAAAHTGITEEMPTMESDLSDTTGEVPAMESDLADTTGEVPAIGETEVVRVSDHSGITAQMPSIEETGATEEMPTAEMPLAATDATGETPTIEEQFRVLEETGELPVIADDEATRLASLDDTGDMPSIGDDEATKLASLDDEDDIQPEATAEIELHDLGLDLDGLEQTSLASDLDDGTAQHEALPYDDDLDATGTNEGLEQLDDMAATGSNPEIDTDAETATGVQEAFDVEEQQAGEQTASHLALGDPDDTDVGIEIDTSLLDATGQTQILTEEMIVETTGGIENVISDEDNTLLPSVDDDGDGMDGLQEDAETLLAPLDEDESRPDDATIPAATDQDFDFAKTEALPKDVFTGVDPLDDSGEMPGIVGTDVDLDLDDLTAALRVNEAGDTIDQPIDDATIEHPGPTVGDIDLNVGGTDDDDDMEPTARFSPDEVSGDLHDARTMTEVGTKLDLARAYVDMGDPGGARSILEEVLDEGDDGQKQQAQQLLESLPG